MQTSTETPKKTPRAAKATAHRVPADTPKRLTKAGKAAVAARGLAESEVFTNPAPHSETKVMPTPKVAKAPKAKAPPAPKGQTKSAKVIALLSRTKGATNAEIMEATGWQTHSVRGFLAQLKKQGMTVAKTVGGTPPVSTYRIQADEAV